MNGCSFYILVSVCGRKKIGPADINSDDISVYKKVSGRVGLHCGRMRYWKHEISQMLIPLVHSVNTSLLYYAAPETTCGL